jgi:predicted DsbA family dithiol-disulfide isomerase
VAFQAVLLADPDRADAVHRRLLEAYFAENRDISDNGELRTVVAEAGADIAAYDAVLAEHRSVLARQVIVEHNDAISQGITAVPTVVIDGVLPVPGAQSVDDYERWISRLTRYQEQTSR